MSTYVIVDINPNDVDSFKKYSAAAGPIIEKYNGKFATTSKGSVESLNSKPQFEMKVVIEFLNEKSAQAWYQSNEYQALLPIGDNGVNCAFHLIKR